MKALTKTGKSWFAAACAGLRDDQIASLDAAMRLTSERNHAPKVGGNHVLEALLRTGLYQRTSPGPTV